MANKTCLSMAVARLNTKSAFTLDLVFSNDDALSTDGDKVSIKCVYKKVNYLWTSTSISNALPVVDYPEGLIRNRIVHRVRFDPPMITYDDPSTDDLKILGENDLVVVNVTVTSGTDGTTTSGVAAILP